MLCWAVSRFLILLCIFIRIWRWSPWCTPLTQSLCTMLMGVLELNSFQGFSVMEVWIIEKYFFQKQSYFFTDINDEKLKFFQFLSYYCIELFSLSAVLKNAFYILWNLNNSHKLNTAHIIIFLHKLLKTCSTWCCQWAEGIWKLYIKWNC